jgi:acyl-phosphate glycerol 3-phosphate acyltransferase
VAATPLPFLLGFLLGSLPMAWLLVRVVTRQDISAQGSGNVGALNASRVSSSKWVGVGVLVFDALKGASAVWLAVWWTGGWDFAPLAAASLGAVAGHNYNPWLSLVARRLVGGKGFAAAAGAMLVLRPWLVPVWLGVALLAWFGFRALRGIVDEAPASAVATMALIPLGYVLYDPPTAWLGLGLSVLCVPKIWAELKTLLFSGPVEA